MVSWARKSISDVLQLLGLGSGSWNFWIRGWGYQCNRHDCQSIALRVVCYRFEPLHWWPLNWTLICVLWLTRSYLIVAMTFAQQNLCSFLAKQYAERLKTVWIPPEIPSESLLIFHLNLSWDSVWIFTELQSESLYRFCSNLCRNSVWISTENPFKSLQSFYLNISSDSVWIFSENPF